MNVLIIKAFIKLEIMEKAVGFRPDLSINSIVVEPFSIELSCDKKRNTLINVLYRSLMGLVEPLEKFLNEIVNKTNKSNKMFHIAVEFNLNVLDHDNYKNYRIFQIYCIRII